MTEKPIPHPNADSQPYWDACKAGRLIYQRCTACDRAQFYPRALCVHCGDSALEWRESAGAGVVHAATDVHIGLSSFKSGAPYAIVLVDMDEGFRIMTNIAGGGPAPPIGARGRIVFEDRPPVALPQFTPAR